MNDLSKRSLMLPAAAGAVLLTMMSLGQVFTRQRWWVPSLLAVALAFGAGWVARRLDVPGALAPALSLLVLVSMLGLVFLPGTTAFGLPTAATMEGIGELLSAAGADIREMAPPADPTDGLTMLATAGVFLVAMIIDLFVFTLRRPVASGMPLLALYLIPTSMADDANVFAFVLSAVGYLGLLVAEGRDRARNWGRRLSGLDFVDDVADVSHVARVGRRIGSAAVGIALCVPLALPSVGNGIFDGAGGGYFGRGRGARTAYVLNPMVEIRAKIQDRVVRPLFTVRTEAPEYLRLTSLDHFDGQAWSLIKRDVKSDHRVGEDKRVKLPRELENITTLRQRYDVTVGDLAVNWLPVPYAPAKVDVSAGDWRYEDYGLSVFSAERTSRDISFVAESVLPQPTVEQLRAGGEIPERIREYLKVPRETPRLVLDVLAAETADATTPYDKAVAINSYFAKTGGFVYDLTVGSGNATADIEAFLINKRGYCEQFAAAMAYMARLAGIPARVVVGFTPGSQTAPGTYVVTNRDAHAWPELYFPGTGWVRFEPTTRSGTVQPGHLPVPATTNPGTPADPGTPRPTAEPTASGAPRPRALDEADNQAPGEDGEQLDPAAAGGGADGGVPMVPVAAGLLAVALVTPSTVAALTRRRRRTRAGDHLARIHAAWDSLADAAEDVGHPLRKADSPRGAARRLVASAALTGSSADEVLRLAGAEERARYARSAAPVDGLDEGVRAVRKALLATLPAQARVRALVFPASAVRRIVEGARALGAFGDRTRATLRAKTLGALRRRRPRAA